MNHTRSVTVIVVVLILSAACAMAELQTQIVHYADGNTVLKGYFAWDDKFEGKRPAVIVFHEWWGLNDYARMRANQLAAMGYLAFAADMYGDGQVVATREKAGKLAKAVLGDRLLARRRVNLALEKTKSHGLADAAKVAAIGYCFGGTCALELARSGADLAGVVSFHGGLTSPKPTPIGKIKARVLVLHGGDDPHVPDKDLVAFQAEMRRANADWQIVTYGGAVHAFSNPASGDDASDGVAYNAKAAKRSWAAMKLFFLETIGLPAREGDGIGKFAREKIAAPVVKAGKKTGEAVKKAARWTWDKLKKDGE